jgi:hypothetical protein
VNYPNNWRPSIRLGYVRWRPDGAHESVAIFECGGPLVHHETGQVLRAAELPPEIWSRFCRGLPAEGWQIENGVPTPRPELVAA